MMLRALLFLALAVLGGSASAGALIVNPASQILPSFGCPLGAGLGDGCPNPADPTGTNAFFSQPDYFTGYANTDAGTTASYSSTRPQYNVTCVDYKCGPYTALASLSDITTMALPAGCSVGTGAFVDPEVTCNSGGTLSHFRADGAGGHNGGKCVSLSLNGTAPYILDDFYFDATDPNCAHLGWFIRGNVAGMNLTASNFYMNGEGTSSNGVGNVQAAIAWQGTMNLSYFALIDFAGRPISFVETTAAGSSSIKYFYIDKYVLRASRGHGEAFFGGPGVPDNASALVTASYGLMTRQWYAAAQGQAPWFPVSNGPVTIAAMNVDHVGAITQNVGMGGKTVTMTGCIGSDANGSCATPGNTFWVHSVSAGAVGQGQALPSTCKIHGANNTGAYLWQRLSGPGGAGANAYLSSWSLDGTTSPTAAPNLIMDAGACSGSMTTSPFTNGFSTTGLLGGTINYSFDYGDFTNIIGVPNGGQTIFGLTNNGSTLSFLGVVSGTNLAPAATLSSGEIVYNSGITGCSATTVLSCPTVGTGGTLASFTISPSVSAFGPATLLGLVNEASFTGTITVLGGVPTLTTSTSKTLTAGDFVEGVGVTGCSTGPTSCPTIKTTATGTSFALTAGAAIGPIAMNTLRNTTSFSGSVNATTLTPAAVTIASGSSVTTNTGTGIAGCTAAEGGVSGCPTVPSGGTGNSFTLSGSGGSFVGTIQVGMPSVCPSPATLHDNWDLSGIVNTTTMNQINFFGQFKWWSVGC